MVGGGGLGQFADLREGRGARKRVGVLEGWVDTPMYTMRLRSKNICNIQKNI